MHGALIGAQPNATAQAFTLVVGGSDLQVTGQSTTAGAVDYRTIEVEEEGPGGVSGMRFSVFDPLATVSIADESYVEFWDVTNDRPLFAGFVQNTTVSTNGVGRTIDVDCIGIEVLLDWQVLTRTLDFSSGFSPISGIIQILYGYASGVGVPLNTAWDGVGALITGDQDHPLGAMSGLTHDVFDGGTTMREAIRQLDSDTAIITNFVQPTRATVDFRRGLRVWPTSGLTPSGTPYDPWPADYPTLTIVEAGAGIHATTLEHATDEAAQFVGVMVNGGNAAGTDYLGAGIGKPGPSGVINDDTILTNEGAIAAAQSFLAEHGETPRGSLTIEAWAPDDEYRPGGPIVITNTQVGLNAAQYFISKISKRFVKTTSGTRETWTVSYGALPPSMVRDFRRVTRTVLA